MLMKLFGGLAIAAALIAGGIAGTSDNSTDPQAKGACCTKNAAGCSEDCCKNCPDCDCEGPCCDDCTDGCECPNQP